ncbi:hypothetical protein [Pelagibius sp.]|uniref:hypothetical protein n=1 Tax=Pelagibius sp. TaxID=1931238 RepID=UPI003B508847
MTTTKLELTDYHEIYALHRALLEGKFSRAPFSTEVTGSPFVASVANKTMDALIQKERDRGREDYARIWEERRQMSPKTHSEYWEAAIRSLEGSEIWLTWSAEKKKEVAATVLSPFTASDDVMRRFIEEADKAAQR